MPDWEMPAGINILDYEAFVYRIYHKVTGRAYIGCKVVYARRRGKRVVSDYLRYWGSSAELLDAIAIEGHGAFRREILHACRTRRDALYVEAKEMFARDVLTATFANGVRRYFNSNILRIWYNKAGPWQEQRRLYELKPLQCSCGKTIKFSRRHTGACSENCLKKKESNDKAPTRKITRRIRADVETNKGQTPVRKVRKRKNGGPDKAA